VGSDAQTQSSNKTPTLGPVPKSRYCVFALIAIGGLIVDLATKTWAFRSLGMPGINAPYWLWDGVAGFQTSLNEGALFGLGQGWTFFFAGLSVVAGGAIVYWLFIARAATDLWLTVALAAIMAGVLGNLYDRVGMPGLTWHFGERVGEPVYAVRDFIKVMIGDWPWPNFNIADSLLVGGAGVLLWRGVIMPQDAPNSSDEKSA
jgi:signal peptidase II